MMPEPSGTQDTLSEENRIIRRAQAGSREAIERIVAVYMPMIASAAGRMRISPTVISREELIQAGVLGFLCALKRFCVNQGCRLGTYAMAWILGEMRRAIGKAADPTGAYPLLRKIRKTQELLELQNGRTPSIAELAKACQISEAELAETIALAFTRGESAQNSGVSLYEGALCAETDLPLKTEMGFALDTLSRQERQVILLRYFRDLTQAETARILGKSQTQISRMERSALEHLRSALS